MFFCVSVTGALILSLFFAWLPLDKLEGLSSLGVGPLVDDSYIYFNISKNIAGFFSGSLPSLQLSSGFSPLIALLFAPCFYLFESQKELPIHFALSLNAILAFFANILLYGLLRKIVSRASALFLVSIWIWSPYVINQSINGMDTSSAILLLMIILGYYLRINHLSRPVLRSWFLLGAFLGLGFWARTDLGFLGIVIVLDQAWLSLKEDWHQRFLRLRAVFLCGLFALLIASPWMLLTFTGTGHIIPISGRTVHQITSIQFDYSHPNHPGFLFLMLKKAKIILSTCQPFAALSRNGAWQMFVSGLSLIGLVFAVRNRQQRLFLRPLLIFPAFIFAAYVMYVGGWWYLQRYLYPVCTLMLFLHAATLKYIETRFKMRPWLLTAILFLLCIPYVISYTQQYRSLLSKNQEPRFLSGALFAGSHIPPKASVGSFQSGCLSYWLDNQVINLDGVINHEAYLHVKNKTLGSYLAEQQIDYLVEEKRRFKMWDTYLDGQLSSQYTLVAQKKRDFKSRYMGKQIVVGDWVIYKRKSGKIALR